MIYVLGSLHWDVVVRAPRLPALDETLPGQGVDYRFGGKGGNQALAAARAGARVAFAGAVGHDDPGARMLAVLDEAGVDTSGIRRVDTASGMSVAIETQGGDYGAVVVTGANARAVPDPIPSGVTTALIQNEVPETANLALSRALPRQARLILNAAPARPVPAELMARVELLVVNRVEAAQMGAAAFGSWITVETLGADGLRLHREGSVTHHPAPKVDVVSSHGAGDVFCGTLAAALDRGEDIEEALAHAQLGAARHVSRA
ncbi:PfkB family carbohydrate kinase [Jannaschia formosa]|uniref:PfkB family carbohydrate kinase n=1 Tax=Jannaschia formosa TaxID=2259592 RepID=UPI000E1B8855|nr:PfkB family carbohydrate kinase [Jannaschia formosa]TFL16500.1 ribokinase [Jannaschia formosa]